MSIVNSVDVHSLGILGRPRSPKCLGKTYFVLKYKSVHFAQNKLGASTGDPQAEEGPNPVHKTTEPPEEVTGVVEVGVGGKEEEVKGVEVGVESNVG